MFAGWTRYVLSGPVPHDTTRALHHSSHPLSSAVAGVGLVDKGPSAEREVGMRATLAEILDAAARGQFPAPDGTTTVVAQPSQRDAGVIAFTAHSVVFTD